MIDTWKKKWQELLDGAEQKEPAVTQPADKPNYLYPEGKAPEQEPLLPGLGGEPWQGEQGSVGESTGTENTVADSKELAAALEALANSFSTPATPSAAENAAKDTAADRLAAGDALRESGAQKSDTLYDALLAFAGKQDGRYDALIDQISNKGYTGFAGVDDLLAYYAAAGRSEARGALAEGAAENGGNPDSYAAAQAARGRLDFANAGTEAAINYYNGQLDRWLATLQAAGADAADIYGLAQDNVDGTHEAATAEGKLGESLFASLSDMANTRTEANADAFSALLSYYGKLKGNTGSTNSTGGTATEGGDKTEGETIPISPMEIDREYDLMLNPENGVYPKYSATDALIVLWKKYPSMHDYLLEKYNKVLNPGYDFEE